MKSDADSPNINPLIIRLVGLSPKTTILDPLVKTPQVDPSI